MTNLIATAAIGLDIKEVDFFLKTLRKYYSDEVLILIGNNDQKLKHSLSKYNCKFFEIKTHRFDVQLQRYEIYLKLLKKEKFNKILCCDCRDIYFQSNPFNFDYKGEINFFLEDKKIKDCKYNSNWILKTYGKKKYKEICDKIILCSGTVLGKQEKIIEYLELISNHIKKYKYKKKLKYLITFRRDKEGRGCDQAHANYIVHTNLLKEMFFYKNEDGPIATVFHLKKIVFDAQSRLINTKGKPYLLVHQYDKKIEIFSNKIERIT